MDRTRQDDSKDSGQPIRGNRECRAVCARGSFVGGVNSPVRAFRAVGGDPLIIERAAGARLYDADGREYIDYICSWGALILVHAQADVVAAIAGQARLGTSAGLTSPLEIELAEEIARGAFDGRCAS